MNKLFRIKTLAALALFLLGGSPIRKVQAYDVQLDIASGDFVVDGGRFWGRYMLMFVPVFWKPTKRPCRLWSSASMPC